MAETCSSYAIVRVEIVYGKALPGQHGNIVQLVMNRLESRTRNTCRIRPMADTNLCWRRFGWSATFNRTYGEWASSTSVAMNV